ncbi:MAG: dTDP-glucose 4,6-dehydratase [Pseudomonadota bacterium]
MQKTVLITGGAGFIGSSFVELLLKKYPEYIIINVDALTYAGNLHNLDDVEAKFGKTSDKQRYYFVKADIAKWDEVEPVFEAFKIDSVVNFAAESHVDRSIISSEPFLRTNIIGTQVLLDLSRKYAVQRFVQVSTDEVYGSLGSEGKFLETTPLAPNSPYSASKASADLLIRSYIETHKMECLITRCCNNYGPRQFPEKLIPLMINNAINLKSLPVYGEGINVREWIYVDDHCEGINTVMHEGSSGEIYNIGSSVELKNIDLVKILLEKLACDVRAEKYPKLRELNKLKNAGKLFDLITYVKDRPGHDLRYAIDSSKIENELSWKASFDFEKGINQTIDWYLSNEEWIQDIMSKDYLNYYEKMYGNR